jgi:hypothetical protein
MTQYFLYLLSKLHSFRLAKHSQIIFPSTVVPTVKHRILEVLSQIANSDRCFLSCLLDCVRNGTSRINEQKRIFTLLEGA